MKLARLRTISLMAVAVSASAAAAAVPSYAANYESGTLTSGNAGTLATNATAPDAAYLVTGTAARSGSYAIAHRVTFNDPGYYSNDAWRSEAASNREFSNLGTYYAGDEARYGFSFSLREWQSYAATSHEDLIWQFKHVGGRHDIALSVQRDQLRVRWDGNGPSLYVADVLSYVNEWIDVQFDVKWTLDNTGYFTFRMRLPGEAEFGHEVTRTGLATFLDPTEGAGDFGYLKWGLYRNDGSATPGVPTTRLVYHDDIYATALPAVAPEPGAKMMAAVLGAIGLRRRRCP